MEATQKETPTSGSDHAAGVNTHNTVAIVPHVPQLDKWFSTLQASAALAGWTLDRYGCGYSLKCNASGRQATYLFGDLETAELMLQRTGKKSRY